MINLLDCKIFTIDWNLNVVHSFVCLLSLSLSRPQMPSHVKNKWFGKWNECGKIECNFKLSSSCDWHHAAAIVKHFSLQDLRLSTDAARFLVSLQPPQSPGACLACGKNPLLACSGEHKHNPYLSDTIPICAMLPILIYYMAENIIYFLRPQNRKQKCPTSS